MTSISERGDEGDIPAEHDGKQVQEENCGPMLSAVIGNIVIAEKIASYLPLADLKAASESCKDLCRMVRNSQAYGDRTTLLVCKETVALDKFLIETEYPWKGLNIDISLPHTVVDIITDILPSVNRLHLRLARTDKIEAAVLTSFLTALFTNTPELKSIRMESVFLEQILHDVLSDPYIQGRLVKLKTLEICTGNKKNDATHYLDCEEGEDGPFPRNFYQLSFLPFKLETLILGKVCTNNGTEIDHVKFIPDLITTTSETLVELSIHMCAIWKLESMQIIRCPKLKRLAITAYGSDFENVATFLTNQPLLDHLDLIMKDKFSTKLLKVVQTKASKLKSLHITGKMFFEPAITDADHVALLSWDFLANLRSLKEFSICRPFCETEQDAFGISAHRREGSGVSFLKALPPAISKMELRGVNDFWFDAQEDRMLYEDVERIPLLSRFFSNLTELSLIRCDERTLNDALVQSILGNCMKLQKLELSHAPELNNAAITGINPAGEMEGVSLKNLNGLTHLLIKGCNLITIEGILAAVGHLLLRSLEYLGVFAVSKANILKLAEQNPSLESIALHIPDLEQEDYMEQLKADLKSVNRRICKVVDLVYEEDYFEADSNSDADEPPGFGWGGSNISGGPPDYQEMFDDVIDAADYDDYDNEDYDEDEFDYN